MSKTNQIYIYIYNVKKAINEKTKNNHKFKSLIKHFKKQNIKENKHIKHFFGFISSLKTSKISKMTQFWSPKAAP